MKCISLVKHLKIEIMEVVIKTSKLTLNGILNIWNEGHAKFVGSVSFDNSNYHGFLNHSGKVELHVIRGFNTKKLGLFAPENFIYA